jgi:ATP-dependent DNA helicase PIF1
MGSPFPTPSSAALDLRRDRARDSEVLDLFVSLDRPVSLGDSILNTRQSASLIIDDEETSLQGLGQETDQFNRSHGRSAGEPDMQFPDNAADAVQQEPRSNPFEEPAHIPAPKLHYNTLDRDQKLVVDLAVHERKNICCVGGAGTGKSVTCAVIVSEFATARVRVNVVAPSGTAAVNVRAQTLHSFFGLGVSTNKGIDELVRRMKPTVRDRIDYTQTLIIDEISMVSSDTFDRMDRLARAARDKPDKPFGGMQVIVLGDFCQLPPVKPHEHCFKCGKKRVLVTTGKRRRGGRVPKAWRCSENADHGDIPDGDKMWAFKSAAWRSMGFVYTPLTQVHRQQDPTFLNILANVRYGKPFTARDVALLMDHQCDVINAVELVTKRDEAMRINRNRLDRLPETAHTYECQDDFKWHRDLHPELEYIKQIKHNNQNVSSGLRDHAYEEIVELKQGQPVILQRNLNVQKGLVNGAQGVIRHFIDYKQADEQRRSSKEEEHISVLRQNHVQEFMKEQRRNDRSTQLPVVKFNNYAEMVTIFPDCSIEELGHKEPHSLLIRTQVPLLAGWALTIHKAQGMTLEKATVQLGDCWQCGMAYVALSRVKTLKGLKVLDLTPTSMVHPVDDEVKIFLETHFQADFS